MSTIELLQKILDLVYQLNEITDDDWFFDISGHIKSISIHYRTEIKKKCDKCGTESETEDIWLANCLGYTKEYKLESLIKELETHLTKG